MIGVIIFFVLWIVFWLIIAGAAEPLPYDQQIDREAMHRDRTSLD